MYYYPIGYDNNNVFHYSPYDELSVAQRRRAAQEEARRRKIRAAEEKRRRAEIERYYRMQAAREEEEERLRQEYYLQRQLEEKRRRQQQQQALLRRRQKQADEKRSATSKRDDTRKGKVFRGAGGGQQLKDESENRDVQGVDERLHVRDQNSTENKSTSAMETDDLEDKKASLSKPRIIPSQHTIPMDVDRDDADCIVEKSDEKKHKKKKKHISAVVVEDASDSEYDDEYHNSPLRNRRPSPGEWLEPVDYFQND